MIIQELVCKPDGAQEVTQREVPDDFFAPPTPEPTVEEKTTKLEAENAATSTEIMNFMDFYFAANPE